ncbi:MAG: hypothetical protein LBC35_03350 [Coriobacteriales bacterium]|jgi:hypothetical protein|nr:hypothetical protein [Coriobacteriales bacterium]
MSAEINSEKQDTPEHLPISTFFTKISTPVKNSVKNENKATKNCGNL